MNTHNRLLCIGAGIIAPWICKGSQQEMEALNQSLNVLFFIADDLRPELGCYGVEEIHTPAIDSLAADGIVFQNAYCNIPVSGASRASFLTGMYPKYPHRFTSFDASASQDCPKAVPMSGWFRDHGYYTISNGKVFHNLKDHADSWSEYPWRVNPEGYGSDWADFNKWEIWQNEESARFVNEKTHRGPYCESADVPDNSYDDGKATIRTIADIKRLKAKKQPFFLACGFWRPHLPFNAPKKYWDLYRRDEIPLPANMYRPKALPKQVQSSNEIFSYARVDTSKLAFKREARHGYYASVSYVDAQIGRIIKTLKEEGLYDHTIIVLIGDHGWHLGEHGFWGKHNLMQQATRIPCIIRVPAGERGTVFQLIELVDLYPTLCDLCRIPYPEKQLQGLSFHHVFKDLTSVTKPYSFVQWQEGCNVVDTCFSYSCWLSKEENRMSEMLFDHSVDSAENYNCASDSLYERIKACMYGWMVNLKKRL